MKSGMSCELAPSLNLPRMWICWIQLLPFLKPAWFLLRESSIGSRMRFKSTLLLTFAAIDVMQIPLKFVLRTRFPFFGRGIIMLDDHCFGACRSFNTSWDMTLSSSTMNFYGIFDFFSGYIRDRYFWVVRRRSWKICRVIIWIFVVQ